MVFVAGFEQIQAAVTEYVRDYIRAARKRGRSYKAIAEDLRVSHVWVMHLDQPEKYGRRAAGPDLEHRLAELLHGGSIDALRKAAMHVSSGGTVVVEQPQGEALELARTPPPSIPPAADKAKGRRNAKRA